MADEQAAVRQFIAESVHTILAAVGKPLLPPSGLHRRTAPVDIAIPIFNNANLLARCLESLHSTLIEGDEVWLIDDASTDPEVPMLMDDFVSKWPTTHCLRNPRNLGFVGTSNRAFILTHRDIILLNSDTEVTPGWLEALQACLERNPRAGIVCPLSDEATILSVLPTAQGAARASIASAAASNTIGDVQLPTAVGFCMLMRRGMLDDIGLFSDAFSPGYGEENDLSMRALKAGWDILAADQACVFHHSGGSFGAARRSALQLSHQAKLDRLWPEYPSLVQSWWRDNPLRAKTERLAWLDDGREGIVHVLHRQYHVGGTERVARSLIGALKERYRHTLVYPGETAGAWCDFELRSTELCRELMLNNRWIKPNTRIAGHGADLTCPISERALARIVRGSDAAIVHFHHMLHWDSLLLPAVAQAMGCRVVISVHDFWFNCPIHNQLEHSRGQPCGRSHAQPDGRCARCLQAYASAGLERGGSKQNAGAYTQARHGLIRQMLQEADAVLVPAHFIRDKLLQAYALTSDHHIHIQQQGVEISESTPEPGRGPERVIAYFGGDQVLKGAQLVLHMARALAGTLDGTAVKFRIHGRIRGFDASTVPSNVELCGFYNPDDVGQAMQGADLALIPSYYEESFSMVASECWAHGIPVLASHRGALRERVIPGVNGWLVRDMEPETWVQSLRGVLEGDALAKCREILSRYPVTSIRQSADSIHRLYQDLLKLPSRHKVQPPPESLSPFATKVNALRSGSIVTTKPAGSHCFGIVRDHWGTANYRVRFPLQDLARSGTCDSSAPGSSPENSNNFHVVRGGGFAVGPALRDAGARHVAVQPFLSDEGLKLMEFLHRESRFLITLVVDDLWTALPMDNPVRALMPEDVPGRLEYAASLCHSLVLTTPELARQAGLRHENTHIINNALPEWIWSPLRVPESTQRRRLRVGWAGAPQHAGDLAFLKVVMENTADLADWVFLGMCPVGLRALAAEAQGMVPFDAYPSALAGLELDLAIAPLADHAFNRCKSHLKVLEYGILGLPVVASDLEPYRHCPVTLATAADADEWTEKIRQLLESHDSRLEQGRTLRQWVLDHHMMEHRRADWAAALGLNQAEARPIARPGARPTSRSAP